MLLALLALTMAFIGQTAGHCFHGNAKGCQFTCHCRNNDMCDYVTGSCPGGRCNTSGLVDWSGAGCQVGNVAAGKRNWETNHDSIVHLERWHNAVDDNFGSSNASMHLQPGGLVNDEYWMLDLGGKHVVFRVHVHFEVCKNCDSDVYVSLIDNTGNEIERLRTYQPQLYAEEKYVHFEHIVAEKIKIRKGSSVKHTVLSEVQVIGYQYVECSSRDNITYFYGPGCLIPCPEGCGEQCHYIKGDGCTVCRPGFEGPNCREPCRPGRWGERCERECNCEDPDEVCDRTNGGCSLSGCPQHYAGEGCQHQLPSLSDISDLVVSAVGQHVKLNFTQCHPAVHGGSETVKDISYKVKYRTFEDEVFHISPDSVQHIEGQEFNTLTFTVPEANVYYILCVIPYDDVMDLPGQASPCVGVFI